jgi:hypothetical protein
MHLKRKTHPVKFGEGSKSNSKRRRLKMSSEQRCIETTLNPEHVRLATEEMLRRLGVIREKQVLLFNFDHDIDVDTLFKVKIMEEMEVEP